MDKSFEIFFYVSMVLSFLRDCVVSHTEPELFRLAGTKIY